MQAGATLSPIHAQLSNSTTDTAQAANSVKAIQAGMRPPKAGLFVCTARRIPQTPTGHKGGLYIENPVAYVNIFSPRRSSGT
jgi:hypothetical protein